MIEALNCFKVYEAKKERQQAGCDVMKSFSANGESYRQGSKTSKLHQLEYTLGTKTLLVPEQDVC